MIDNTVELSFKNSDTFIIGAGPRDTALCQAVPGTRAGKLNVQEGTVEWTCPVSLFHAVVLRSVFGDRLVYDDDVAAWGQEQIELEEARREILHDHIPEPISAILARWPG